MAEAQVSDTESPQISDDEGIEITELEETFHSACQRVRNIVTLLNSNQLLQFYALYKQATAGPCDTPRPSWYALEAKSKWDAWKKLGEITKDEAMISYIEQLKEVDPESAKDLGRSAESNGWVSVSSMRNGDVVISDEEKTVYDWVKEGKLDRLKKSITEKDVNAKDRTGMALIHWAADRGNVEIIKFLVEEMKANMDIKDEDGQTALHYAACCGHAEVVVFLIDAGAMKSVRDNDGLIPTDVAADADIKRLLIAT